MMAGARKKSKIPILLVGLILLVFGLAALYVKLASTKTSETYIDPGIVNETAERQDNSGTATDSSVVREYNRQEDFERAEVAAARGKSVIPKPIEDEFPGIPPKPEEPEPAPEPVSEPEPLPDPEPRPAPVEYYGPEGEADYSRWFGRDSYTPGAVQIDSGAAKPKKETETPVLASDEQKLLTLGLSPGTVLYAVMDIGANSDQEGTPIMARVVSGEYAGAKFIGGFRRMDKKLVLQFNKAVVRDKDGKENIYGVSGYAINPEDYSPGVASSVDIHFFERWGGLIASSFLYGFGEAKSRSGTTYYYGNDNNPGSWMSDYDVGDEAWIAAGKVGEKLADQFEKNFDMPPTVTLKPGEPIGILIL